MRNMIRPEARSIPMAVPYAGGILSGQGMLVGAFFGVAASDAAQNATVECERCVLPVPVPPMPRSLPTGERRALLTCCAEINPNRVFRPLWRAARAPHSAVLECGGHEPPRSWGTGADVSHHA
jgi:hypothetical protein